MLVIRRLHKKGTDRLAISPFLLSCIVICTILFHYQRPF
nr:MAG TPA: hypothetical protein [Caudoviricetes sp.]